jgi:hypothetical protein
LASEIVGLNDYLPKLLECRKCYSNIWRIEISASHRKIYDEDGVEKKKTYAIAYSCGVCDNKITDDQLKAGIIEVIKARKADVAETP